MIGAVRRNGACAHVVVADHRGEIEVSGCTSLGDCMHAVIYAYMLLAASDTIASLRDESTLGEGQHAGSD